MQVQILDGVERDGEQISCWNAEAIESYADTVNAKEARLEPSADINVIPGRIACRGCVVNQWGNGTMCSAQLTETQFVVVGERAPEPDLTIPKSKIVEGFKMVMPGSGRMAEGYLAKADTVPSIPESSHRTTRRRLLDFRKPR